jgi:hypothetical protein
MSIDPAGIDAEAETDRLYQVLPSAFVEARNALATRLKSSGDKDGAARVKTLARPSLTAWAANQVYWTARAEFDGLVASGERLHKAQLQSGIGGTALRDAMKARREALDFVLRRAAALLTNAGQAANPAVLRRVSNTLEALAADRGRSAQVQPGRLVKDLDPPGFEAFGAAAETDPVTTSRHVPSAVVAPSAVGVEQAGGPVAEPQTEGIDEARVREMEVLRSRLVEAEQRLDRARREAREAAGSLSVATKRAEAARGELDESRRRFERATERAASTAEDEAAAGRKAEELAASREEAEAVRDEALRALRVAE